MSRWALVTLAALLVLGIAAVALARFCGKSGSRPSIAVAIVSRWLAAYVLWSFLGGMAVTGGLLATYQSAPFAMIGLLGVMVEYRVRARSGPERGLTIFVGVQLAWLVAVLLQNGILPGGW